METDETKDKMKDTPENVRLLNEKLGITSRDSLFNSSGISSINEMFESSKRDFELLCKDIAEKKEEIKNAEDGATASFDTFSRIKDDADSGTKLEVMENAAVSVASFSESVQSMKQLIDRGNDMIGKLYDAIVRTDILDPDLLNATASIIHSIRESNDNLIQFNMQKMTLEQQYRLAIESEMLKQKHKLELEYFKHTLKIKEAEEKARIKREENEKNKVDVVVSDDSSGKSWSQSDMAEFIRSSVSK